MVGALELGRRNVADRLEQAAMITPYGSVSRSFGARGEVRCSFCGRSGGDGRRRMVGGPGVWPNQVFICDECVAMCAEILAESDELSPD